MLRYHCFIFVCNNITDVSIEIPHASPYVRTGVYIIRCGNVAAQDVRQDPCMQNIAIFYERLYLSKMTVALDFSDSPSSI